MAKVALAFDLGGTELRGALVERGGRVAGLRFSADDGGAGSEAVIGQIMRCSPATLRDASTRRRRSPASASARRGRSTPRPGS